ncbi:hypothetical protein AALB_1157 [Agarivorans albus MKT 106]|uniref:Uncharacterized protein n=1 Tax=Agarivorans albus MKT 106 TaxID=1331007 RepID=R9PIA7_AGAAL|nr:hypothetical protein AALB_1157 [Agarivorans albus MKT 106]
MQYVEHQLTSSQQLHYIRNDLDPLSQQIPKSDETDDAAKMK